MPWREIEVFLLKKERWILAKLDEWSRARVRRLLHGVSGEALPLFRLAVTLEINAGRRAVRCEPGRLLVSAPAPQRTLKVLLAGSRPRRSTLSRRARRITRSGSRWPRRR